MRRLDAQDAVEAARNAEAQDRSVGLVPFHNPDQTSLREIARSVRAEGALLDDTIRCAVAVDEGVDHLRVEPAYAAPVAYACGIDDEGRTHDPAVRAFQHQTLALVDVAQHLQLVHRERSLTARRSETLRSEERRGGKECGKTGRIWRWLE